MGADDFWAGFGAEASQWSKILAGGILQQAGEKRAEERQVRAEDRKIKADKSSERRQFLYGVDLAKAQGDIGQNFWEKQKDYELKLKRDEAVSAAELQADLDEGFGNINTARMIEQLTESNPEIAEQIIQGVQDIKEDKEIPDLSIFDPLGEAAGPIREAYAAKKAIREDRDLKQKDSVAKRSFQKTMETMYTAQAEMFQKTAESKGAVDPAKYATAQEKILATIKEIKESRSYKTLQELKNDGKLEGNELLDYESWQELLGTAKNISQSLKDIYYASAGINLVELEEVRYRDLHEEIERLTGERKEKEREGVQEYMESGEVIQEMLAPTPQQKDIRKEKLTPGGEKPFDWLKEGRDKSFKKWIKDLFTKGKADVPDDQMEDFQAFVQEVIATATQNLA